MTGSIRWFRYETNGGAIFGFRHDESNIENIQETALADKMAFRATDEDSIQHSIPKNLRMRYAIFKGDDGLSTKRIVIPSRAMRDAYAGQDYTLVKRTFTETIDGVSVTFKYSHMVGERLVPRPSATDTGKTDGDTTEA